MNVASAGSVNRQIVQLCRACSEFRSGDVDCDEGEFIVVPKGIEHCPLALSDETHVLLVEQSSVLNTGSAAVSRRRRATVTCAAASTVASALESCAWPQDAIGEHVHAEGRVPLTKHELKRVA